MDGAIPPCNVLLNHRPLMHLTSASSTILSGESVSFAFLQYRDLDLSFGNAISGKPQLSQTMKAGVPISHEKKQHTPHHLWCYIFRCTFSACHPPSHGSPPGPSQRFPFDGKQEAHQHLPWKLQYAAEKPCFCPGAACCRRWRLAGLLLRHLKSKSFFKPNLSKLLRITFYYKNNICSLYKNVKSYSFPQGHLYLGETSISGSSYYPWIHEHV